MQLSASCTECIRQVARSAACVVVLVLAGPQWAGAQTYTAFSVFGRMTAADLATCQLKLTENVLQCSFPPPTWIFAVAPSAVDLQAFHSFERRGFTYISDYTEVATGDPDGFTSPRVTILTARELQAAIAAVNPLGGVVDGGVDSSAALSFALLQKSGGRTRCFEALLDDANATLLLSALKQALIADAPAYDALAELACDRWLGPTNARLLSNGEVRIALGEPRRNPAAGDERFDGSVTVTNVSPTTLSSPLILVLNAQDWLVTLLGESGHTCRIKPVGAPYLVLPVGSGLRPNTSVTLPLAFTNPLGNPIELSYTAPNDFKVEPRVYQGTGER